MQCIIEGLHKSGILNCDFNSDEAEDATDMVSSDCGLAGLSVDRGENCDSTESDLSWTGGGLLSVIVGAGVEDSFC